LAIAKDFIIIEKYLNYYTVVLVDSVSLLFLRRSARVPAIPARVPTLVSGIGVKETSIGDE